MRTNRRYFSRESLPVIIPAVLAFVLLVGVIYGVILPFVDSSLLDRKKEMLRELTRSAREVLVYYHGLEETGAMSRQMAQEAAVQQVRRMRYGNDGKDYFWINDMTPAMVVHPYRPDLDGKGLVEFTDPDGRALFVDFVHMVEQQGAGFVPYHWQWKDDPSRIVPKLSYVMGFAPWDWIIGTGLYLEDVNREIAALTRKTTMFASAVLLLISLLSAFIVRRSLAVEQEVRRHREGLEELVHQRTVELRAVNQQLQGEVAERLQAEVRVQQQNDFLKTVINSLPYSFYVVDINTYEVLTANEAATRNGWTPGETCHQLTHHRDTPCDGDHVCPLQKVKETGETVVVEHIHYDRDGKKCNFQVHAHPIFNDQGTVVQMIEFSVDITEMKHLEERLRQISITDEMTGLLNRRGFLRLAEQQLRISDRSHDRLFLLYADLDNLKRINDRHGHAVGDDALTVFATVLRQTFRRADIIGRLGGDEFAVLLTDSTVDGSEECASARLDEELARVNDGGGLQYVLEVSTGIVAYDPESPCSVEDLMSRADVLMYQEKRKKKNGAD